MGFQVLMTVFLLFFEGWGVGLKKLVKTERNREQIEREREIERCHEGIEGKKQRGGEREREREREKRQKRESEREREKERKKERKKEKMRKRERGKK